MNRIDLAVLATVDVVRSQRAAEIFGVIPLRMVVLDAEVTVAQQALCDDQVVRFIATREPAADRPQRGQSDHPSQKRSDDRGAFRFVGIDHPRDGAKSTAAFGRGQCRQNRQPRQWPGPQQCGRRERHGPPRQRGRQRRKSRQRRSTPAGNQPRDYKSGSADPPRRWSHESHTRRCGGLHGDRPGGTPHSKADTCGPQRARNCRKV